MGPWMTNQCVEVMRCILVTLSISSLALASDRWPQFRGPNGDGQSSAKNVPLTWSDSKNIAFKVELPGAGWSSPVVDQGRVYLTYAQGPDEAQKLNLGVCCIDAASGKILWREVCFSHNAKTLPGIHKKNSHASPTPVIDGDQLFVHFGHLGTACLSTAGDVNWKNEEIKYSPVHGSGASPILHNGLLMFSCDGAADPFVVALDAKTGKVAWKTPRKQEATKYFAFATSHVIQVNGQEQLITQGADCLMALNPLSGEEYWRVSFAGYSIIPRPLFANGLIYISTGYDSPKLLAVKPRGPRDSKPAAIVWEFEKGAPNTPSPVIVGERLYMVSDKGIATCLDALTGKQVWQERVGGNFSASLWTAEGRIYFLDEEGTTTVISPGERYQALAKNQLQDAALATPAIVDGAIFLRGESHLYKIASP